MQTLYIKIKDGQGRVRNRVVKVIRAWTEGGGKQLFLHADGTYGYKDGAPALNEAELDIISSPAQRKLAQLWWNRVGARKSADYYRKQEQDLQERQSQGVLESVSGDSSDLDMILYIRRPVTTRARDAFSDPSTWYEWFETRPEWWGFANVIEISGYRYEVVEVKEEVEGGRLKTEGEEEDAHSSQLIAQREEEDVALREEVKAEIEAPLDAAEAKIRAEYEAKEKESAAPPESGTKADEEAASGAKLIAEARVKEFKAQLKKDKAKDAIKKIEKIEQSVDPVSLMKSLDQIVAKTAAEKVELLVKAGSLEF